MIDKRHSEPGCRPNTRGGEPTLVLNQHLINDAIVDMLDQATTTFTWISMMSQHTCTTLIDAVHRALHRGVDVRIFHSINPYVALHKPHPYPITVLPMHGVPIPATISSIIGAHVHDFRSHVTHARFVVNDDAVLFVGCDYNNTLTVSSYVQHALLIRVKDAPVGFDVGAVQAVVQVLRRHGDLQTCVFGQGGVVGTTAVGDSAVDQIVSMIATATRSVFIENQYIEHKRVLEAVWRRQVELGGRLAITLVGNLDFGLNPYHPTKGIWVVEEVLAWFLRRKTTTGLQYLKGLGCSFRFRVYPGRYTHNKIFVVDEQQICWGTFNLNERSLDRRGDTEIGVYLADGGTAVKQYVARAIGETVEICSPYHWTQTDGS